MKIPFCMQISEELKKQLEAKADELETSIAALMRQYAVRGLAEDEND